MMAFSGSDFGNPAENPAFAGDGVPTEPPSLQFSKDAHAAVGRQAVIDGPSKVSGLAAELIALADGGAIELVARWTDESGFARAWLYSGGVFIPNQNNGATLTTGQLESLASPGAPVTFEAVPVGLGVRTALDRDEDGFYDYTEVQSGSNPADANSTPANIPAAGYGALLLGLLALVILGGVRMERRAKGTA